METTYADARCETGIRAPRLAGLDLIRAVAIAWVMLYHAKTLGLLSDVEHGFVAFGWIGVDLFFGLSGFLIAGQILRPFANGLRPDYGRFFSRRLLRTFPAYLVIVAIYFAIPAAREREEIQPLWQFLTFTENLLIDLDTPKTFSHAWSLCVEEQFYFMLPIIAALLAIKPSARKVCAVLVAVLIFGMLVRGYLWLAQVAETPFRATADPDWRSYMTLIYYPTWSRLDGLLVGVAAAVVKVFRPVFWQKLTARPNLLLGVGVAGIAVSILFFKGLIAALLPAVFGFPLLALSIVLVVAAGTDTGSIIDRYRVPGARALATGAYSLYLSHKIAFHLVIVGTIPSFGATGPVKFGIALVAALLIGAMLYWLVERPFLKLRDRLDGPSRSSIAAERVQGTSSSSVVAMSMENSQISDHQRQDSGQPYRFDTTEISARREPVQPK